MNDPDTGYRDSGDEARPGPWLTRFDAALVAERLNLAQVRCHKLTTTSAILATLPPDDDGARLRVFVETDGPWLIAQVRALLAERDSQARHIADLATRLDAAQAKGRRQAAEITRLQGDEGRRAVQGKRGGKTP